MRPTGICRQTWTFSNHCGEKFAKASWAAESQRYGVVDWHQVGFGCGGSNQVEFASEETGCIEGFCMFLSLQSHFFRPFFSYVVFVFPLFLLPLFSRHIFLVIFNMANAAWSVRCRWSPKPVKGKGRPRSARWTKKIGAVHGALRDPKLAGFKGTAWNSSVSLFQRSPRSSHIWRISHVTYLNEGWFMRFRYRRFAG